MPSMMTGVATRFVDLVLKYEPWSDVANLPLSEMQVLFDIVSAAGFNPRQIRLGQLVGYYCDQGGSNTGETYPINKICPFKIVGQEADDYAATNWLDCTLQHVLNWKNSRKEERDEIIEVLAEDIERSIPLTPIQLNLEGDMLREFPSRREHTRDHNNLGSCVGVHMYCDSWMDRRRATSTHDAIVCRGCYLRVLFPKETKTYGDLRQALAFQCAQVPG